MELVCQADYCYKNRQKMNFCLAGLYEIFINEFSPNFGIYEIFPYDYGNAGWLIFRKNAEIFWKNGILYGKFSEVSVKIYTSNILIGGGKTTPIR